MKPVYPAVSAVLLTAGIILVLLPAKGAADGGYLIHAVGHICIYAACCVPLVYIARRSREKHKRRLLEHNELMRKMKLAKQQREGTSEEEQPIQTDKRVMAVGIALLVMPYLLVLAGIACITADRIGGGSGSPLGSAGTISMLVGGLLIVVRNIADIFSGTGK
ncbi:MAG: hypothetical protein IJT87_03135 [Ruminiclostridium sp.]|nr:hypothetical protein [Ruminiclostridium sp.]